MRKVFISLASTFSLFAAGCGAEHGIHKNSEKVAGAWQSTPIVIDGKSNDWPSPYPYDNSKAAITYDITNDKENLYITVKTGDQATELKILRNGLLVWIDRTASKTQTTSICFPSDNQNAGEAFVGTQGREILAQHIDAAMASVNEFFIQGFKGCRGKFNLPQGDSCGIKVGIGFDEFDQLVWEAVIPIRTFYPKGAIDKRDMEKPFDICFDIKGLDRPANDNHAGNGMHMGGMGIGVGGLSMGMPRGSNRNYADNGNEQLYKSNAFWKKVGFAYKD